MPEQGAGVVAKSLQWKVIEASVQELVFESRNCRFRPTPRKMRAATNSCFEDAVEYPKAINSLLENP